MKIRLLYSYNDLYIRLVLRRSNTGNLYWEKHLFSSSFSVLGTEYDLALIELTRLTDSIFMGGAAVSLIDWLRDNPDERDVPYEVCPL